MCLLGFVAPWWLALLGAVAVLLVGYVLAQRRSRTYLLRFSNLALLNKVMPRQPSWPRHIPAALLAVALVSMVIGLGGPTCAAQVPRNRAIVMLVVDVSLSMQAHDVEPSRLAAAEDAAIDFVQGLPPGINLGLESFAGTAAVLVSPSVNREQVIDQIHDLTLAESTATGDALAAALHSIDAFEQQIPGGTGAAPPAEIVLMSDGKQTVGTDEYAVAGQAAQQGIPINTISFGTPYGQVQINGQWIPVPVDDAALSEVAQISKGNFFTARDNTQIHQVYDTLRSQIGYQTRQIDRSKPWYILGTLTALLAAGLAINRGQRLPI
ncbi:MAG TPA: VWA domain-containing protein [Pseudonocardia sp.]